MIAKLENTLSTAYQNQTVKTAQVKKNSNKVTESMSSNLQKNIPNTNLKICIFPIQT